MVATEVNGVTLKTVIGSFALTLSVTLMSGCGGGGSSSNSNAQASATSSTLQMSIVGPDSVWSDQTDWRATAQVTTTDAGTVTYSIDAGTTGLQIDSASGVINAASTSPISLDAGEHTFTVSATSDSGASGTGEYSITSKVVLTGHLLQSGIERGMVVSREGLFRFFALDEPGSDLDLDLSNCLGKITVDGTALSGTVRCNGVLQKKDESYSFLGDESYSFLGDVVEHTAISFTSKTYVDGSNAGTTSTVADVFEYRLRGAQITETLESGVFAAFEPISWSSETFDVPQFGVTNTHVDVPQFGVTNTHVVRLGIDGTIKAINQSGCQTDGALHAASLVNWTGIGDATITNSNCLEEGGGSFLDPGYLLIDPDHLGNFTFRDINQVALPSLFMAADVYVSNYQAPSKGIMLTVPGNPDSNNNFNIAEIVFLRVCDEQQQITPIGISSGWNSCEEFLSSID